MKRSTKPTYELELVRASSIPAKKQEWLWENRILRNTLTGFVGEPDKGKGVVSIDLVARLTTGRNMPDGTTNPFGEPIEVLMLIAEDDLRTTVVPRLLAAGADLGKVYFAKSVSMPHEKDTAKRQFYFDTDLDLIKQRLFENPEIKLV